MQKYSENNLRSMIPVFHLKPKTSTRTQCILTMYSHNEERINDTQLDIETSEELKAKIGENTLLIGIINNYFVIGKFCSCNIPGDYLINNVKNPVYYLSIIYNKQFLTGCLFNMFLYFNIDEETKNRLNEPKKYYKAFLDGKYTIQFVPTDEDFLDKVKEMIQENLMIKYNEEFNNAEKEENYEIQDKIMEKIVEETNLELKEYEQFFEEKPFDIDNSKFPSQKVVLNKLNLLCDTPIFKKLLSYGLEIRENQRVKEKCPDISYEIPKNVINLSEIKKNPVVLDKYVNKI